MKKHYDEMMKRYDEVMKCFDHIMNMFPKITTNFIFDSFKKIEKNEKIDKGKVKQVIIIRKDLNMTKGKMCAQTSHASLGVILNLMENKTKSSDIGNPNKFFKQKILTYSNDSALDIWLNDKFTKICVYVNSEQELLDLQKRAEKAGLINCLIKDAGDTMFHGVPTFTTLAIGPAYSSEIDPITKSLPLL